MRQMELPIGLRRILPGVAALCLLTVGGAHAEDSTNELNSPIDEPTVIIEEHKTGIPVRPASRAVQESTDPLVKLVYETREAQRRRLLSTNEHTPWQIMHGLVGLREDLLLKHDGQIVNGLDWIATGPMYQNEPWFSKTSHGGQAHPYNKPWWFEGHINQFAAILSMASVPLDQQFGTPNGPITMREMIRNAQMTVNAKEEVTWTLWLLSRYLPPDAEWTNAKGERWSIERIVKVEVGKPVGGPTSPCGGAHGLFALAHARNVYLRTGKPLRGVWLESEQKIQKYIRTARVQLNADGTLSSSFFKGREYKQDFDKRMASCGHLLEFLMMAVSENQLNEPWVRKALEGTANDLMANRKAYVSCSPLYHATNGLSIYLDRVAPATSEERMAVKPERTKTISQSRTLPNEAASSSEKPAGPATTVPEPPAANAPASEADTTATPAEMSPTVPQAVPDARTGDVSTGEKPPGIDPAVPAAPVPDEVPQAQPAAPVESVPATTPDAPSEGAPATAAATESSATPAASGTSIEPAATSDPPEVISAGDPQPAAVSPSAESKPATESAGPADMSVEIVPQLKPVPLDSPPAPVVVTPNESPATTQPNATPTSNDSAAPGSPEPQGDEKKPEPKRGSWKATPPERRRPIVVVAKS